MKTWKIKIKSGKKINKMTMIDPDNSTHSEIERVLHLTLTKERVIEFKEVK